MFKYIGILFWILLAFNLSARQDDCKIKILQRDTVILASSQITLTLTTDDSADYYQWYLNGELIDSCSKTVELTLNTDATYQITVIAGFETDTNYIPNPHFDDGFTGFTTDSSLSVSDTLLYNSGHYNIGISTSDFITDICHSTSSVNTVTDNVTNGTNALMVAPKSKGAIADTITIYKTKFKVKPQRDYVLRYCYYSPVRNCYQQVWTSTMHKLFINGKVYGENYQNPHFNSDGLVDYYSWGCNYYVHPNLVEGGKNFIHSRTERFFVPNDSLEIELQARQASSQGFSTAFYILDSLQVKEICYAYDTVNIKLQSSFTVYDSAVNIQLCQNMFPIYFNEETIRQQGVYEYHMCDSAALVDTVVYLNVQQLPVYSDTVKAEILKGKTYSDENFSESDKGIYTLELISSEGCDSVIVLDLNVINLVFPTVITPNGDGINDIFEISGLLNQTYYEKTRLIVYNRFGKCIFNAENIRTKDNFWNPAVTNSPSGTYFYRFTAKGKEKDLDFTGAVEVLR